MTPARPIRARRDDGIGVDARATTFPWRVVRFDGVLLAGAGREEDARRLASVLSQGQRADFVAVSRRVRGQR